MLRISIGLATLFMAGLAGLACTEHSGMKLGGSGGAGGTGGTVGSGGSQAGAGGASVGASGAGGCMTTLCAMPAHCPYGYQESTSLCGCLECAPPPDGGSDTGGLGGALSLGGTLSSGGSLGLGGASGLGGTGAGGTGGTSSCPTITCLIPVCLGELRPNPSDPCCPVICVPNTPDAGVPDAGNRDATEKPLDAASVTDGDAARRTPLQHRATGTTCPVQRAAGLSLCPDASTCQIFGECGRDSNCSAGKNGRCLIAGPAPATACSYDTCFADADCPANIPCDCRNSASSQSPNSCLTGSDCRVDSDCGPANFCSFSQDGWWGGTYHCHTASDLCVNDNDCAQFQNCTFNKQNGYWSCVTLPPPPP